VKLAIGEIVGGVSVPSTSGRLIGIVKQDLVGCAAARDPIGVCRGTAFPMSRIVTIPSANRLRADGMYPGGWWHDDAETGRIVCDLCPRACSLKEGDRGFCFVRQNLGNELVLTTYGKSTGFCIDPIEKKPLNHFYPGTSVLSFGTAGCNLGCKFCQNWDISKSREVERLSELATPEAIARAAQELGCRSVAFTYNDPVIWAEYAIETARACRAVGVKTVAVTAGYISPDARAPFYEFMDAANVDLKGFTEEFYHRITYSHLQPVLDTLEWLKKETDVWFEITNLVIPQANDSRDEIREMCAWILGHVGDDVPVHFTAFHPDFRMRDRPNTPHETLLAAHEIARGEGLKHVYVGNVNDVAHQSTYCAHCGARVIERDWYALGAYDLIRDCCRHCGGRMAGRFDDRPGAWGRKRVPVEISRFGREPDVITITSPRAPMNTTTEAVRSSPAPSRSESGSPKLSPDQYPPILSAAAEFVAASILGRPATLADPTVAGAADVIVSGAYVTLKRRGHLRACCGFLGQSKRLIDGLYHAAGVTATEDHRLPPISATELPFLDLSVNLLHDLEPIRASGGERVGAVNVGQHGLRIHRGEASGLLLPAVATEHGWDSETFLRQVCRKAGLPSNAWEDDSTQIFTFESVEFSAPFDPDAIGTPGQYLPPVSKVDLRQLAAYARGNIVALAQGQTPNYYAYGIPDGNVTGLVLSINIPGRPEPIRLAQLAFRPGVPLQTTLFRLCEQAAAVVAQMPNQLGAIQIGITVFFDPAMHGTLHNPDLRGLTPTRRALLLMEHDKTAWVFTPTRTAEDLLETASREITVLNPQSAGVFSLQVCSTEPGLVFRIAPTAVAVGGTRPAAVAGKFYPADPTALTRLVDGLIGASEHRPEEWPAAMLPHAGLSFSGQLAASVLNRLKIPDLVVVIGPKHTRQGVDWAVAPHEAWSIPGATVPSDPAFARDLAAAVDGLELDATAHQFEHAIEVELPLIARLAPHARVVGVAIGGGTWEGCQRIAAGLAEVLKRQAVRPLLLISSDMNHFANDSETRQLDELALEAMERLDPAHLLATVTEHHISMCGALPAVIVMETLRLLGGLTRCERVGYATSGDVTGDLSRVVGYAGTLLA
jgi:AmmeMemoRadiSam system radical SAM enzyme/AmmeMemoRadiSam system protein B/AmmeMemoRadiSam system protein A